MLSDGEEMCEVQVARKKNRSELGENLTGVCQFQLLHFQPGLFSADRLFLQRPECAMTCLLVALLKLGN